MITNTGYVRYNGDLIAETTVLLDLPPDETILFTVSGITVIANKYFGEIDSDLSLSQDYRRKEVLSIALTVHF